MAVLAEVTWKEKVMLVSDQSKATQKEFHDLGE